MIPLNLQSVLISIKYIALHIYNKFQIEFTGHKNQARLTQCIVAVTGRSLNVEKEKFQQVGGFDKSNLKIANNDIDPCLLLRKAGYKIV